MKFWSTLATVLVLPAVLARPITPVAITSNAQILTTRGALDKAINTARAQGSGGSKQKAVTGAANSFAGDVAIVSRSLNSIGTTTDPSTTRSLARDAFVAEKDEDQHRAVLDSAAGGDADRANQKIVDNTPIVLKGLQSIMSDPGMDNTMRNLAKIESARYVGSWSPRH